MSPMKGEKIALSERQLQRYRAMSLVEAGKITLKEAAEKIGRSYRQAKRIWKRVKEEGVRGVIHGNTGKPSNYGTPEELQKRVLQLSRERYEDFNDVHFTQMLTEREEIGLSRETIRKMRRGAGILAKRKRRPPRHRQRRERRVQEGLMVLWDGSPHPWFGLDRSPCCLMVGMDDARGVILAARFFPFEGSSGYLWLLRRIVKQYGIPVSIYQDCHGALHRNDDDWTLEEELAGKQEPTQVGWALQAFGIHPIFALSPQAKGRIERLFGTLQDRLGAELRLGGITNIPEANDFLETTFILDFNHRFGVKPQQSEKAWRKVPPRLDLDRWISFRYCATVGNDNTVRLGGLLLDIPPQGRSYAKAKVEVRQLLDGSWRIYYQDHLLAKHPPTELKEPVRALPRNKSHAKGVKLYNWVYMASSNQPPVSIDLNNF